MLLTLSFDIYKPVTCLIILQEASGFVILCGLFARCQPTRSAVQIIEDEFRYLQFTDAVKYHGIAILPATLWKTFTGGVKNRFCSCSGREYIIANVEYGSEGCMHG